jgi:Domain of unknown function (DUF5658)
MKKGLKVSIIIITALTILDLIFTYIYMSRFGIENELNPVGRFFIENLGLIPGLFLNFIITIGALFVIGIFSEKINKKIVYVGIGILLSAKVGVAILHLLILWKLYL